MTILSRIAHRPRRAAVVATLTGLALALPAAAQANEKCTVPMADWQPREALEQKLTAKGWEVRRIKIDDGCYEVYAIDPQGRRAEVHFDPQSLAPVGRGGNGDDDRD